MLGIVVAVIVAAWTVFISGGTMEAGFLSATGFLWVWYWIWTAVIGLIVGGIMLAVTGAITVSAADFMRSNKLGGFFGFLSGGALSAPVLAVVAVARGLLLGGTYLLMTSGGPGVEFAEFSTNNLIFGTLLLVVGLIMSRASSFL